MKILPLFALMLLPFPGIAASLLEAQANASLKVEISGDARSQLTVAVTNAGSDEVSIEVPSGLIAVGKSGARVATIRSASLNIAKGQTGEMAIPVVPLSLKNGASREAFAVTADRVDRLRPLLEYSTQHNDLPRTTSQLVALFLVEDVDFVKWQEFLQRETAPEPRPTPADIAAAVDAISITRQLVPDRKIAVANEPEFRLRALRNPWSRAKAMQLFGMNPPEGVPIPDLKQLLHTRPGDNCPVCRLRGQGADPSNGL